MYVDTKKHGEVQADPFKLSTLISWLEKQPKNQTYDYACNGHCLLAEYFADMGFKNVTMGGFEFSHCLGFGRHEESLPDGFNDIAIGEAIYSEWTYGQALQRARKYEKLQHKTD